jgi:uncharacterized protein YggU (UPF0235/DUF167 family)
MLHYTMETVRLIIKLTPCGSKNKVISLEKDLLGDSVLKAMVTAAPEKGKANYALIDLLSDALKLPKSAFKILRGELSRTKLMEINCSEESLREKARSCLGD